MSKISRKKLSWPLLIPFSHCFADKFVIIAIVTCDCCEFAIDLVMHIVLHFSNCFFVNCWAAFGISYGTTGSKRARCLSWDCMEYTLNKSTERFQSFRGHPQSHSKFSRSIWP